MMQITGEQQGLQRAMRRKKKKVKNYLNHSNRNVICSSSNNSRIIAAFS